MNKITASVAGISFAIKENPSLEFLEIETGGKLKVIAEPENSYDPKAIRLEYNGIKIGYVPRRKEGLDFSVQSWCEDNLSTVSAHIDQVWYDNKGTTTFKYSEGCKLVGIYAKFEIPIKNESDYDVIITKNSFSEPDVVVDFNDTRHIYNMRWNGGTKVLKGGTTFIKRFYEPFDSKKVARQCSKYWGVSAQEIEDLWSSNGAAAGAFGSAVHLALEHYVNFQKTGQIITDTRKASGKNVDGNYAMPKHPFLKKIITDLKKLTDKLDKKYGVQEVVAEALITDSLTGWGGLIDRLVIIDKEKKIARVQDYKINIDASKEEPHSKPKAPFSHLPANKITKYILQMSFYASILKKHGWTIEGLDVFIYEDKWVHYPLEVIDFNSMQEELKEALKKKVVDYDDRFL
jgi:hypothetical protein